MRGNTIIQCLILVCSGRRRRKECLCKRIYIYISGDHCRAYDKRLSRVLSRKLSIMENLNDIFQFLKTNRIRTVQSVLNERRKDFGAAISGDGLIWETRSEMTRWDTSRDGLLLRYFCSTIERFYATTTYVAAYSSTPTRRNRFDYIRSPRLGS